MERNGGRDWFFPPSLPPKIKVESMIKSSTGYWRCQGRQYHGKCIDHELLFTNGTLLS